MCMQSGWRAQRDMCRAARLGLHVVCHDEEHISSCGQAQRIIVAPIHPERAPCNVHRYLHEPHAGRRSGAV
jgi:hypothetical protein